MSKAPTRDALIQQQAEEIERLRSELNDMTRGGEAVYPLPHTLRKGVGDLWRGSVAGRERPDNVPSSGNMGTAAMGAITPTSGPTNQEILEALAGQAIADAQAEG